MKLSIAALQIAFWENAFSFTTFWPLLGCSNKFSCSCWARRNFSSNFVAWTRQIYATQVFVTEFQYVILQFSSDFSFDGFVRKPVVILSFSDFPFTVCVTHSYADECRNIFNTTKTSGHSSLEKYTSHFIRKG